MFVRLVRDVLSFCRPKQGSGIWSRYNRRGTVVELCKKKGKSNLVYFRFSGTRYFARKKDMAGAYVPLTKREIKQVRL